MVTTLYFHFRGYRFDPWSGNTYIYIYIKKILIKI